MNYLNDIRTLSFTASIISLVLCICMIYISINRKTYKGFVQWTIASILYSMGMVLMSFRGILPDLISIVVANTLIIAGVALIAIGLELFTESRKRPWLFLALVLLTPVLCIFFTYFSPNVNARIIIISTIIGIGYGYAGYIVHRQVPRLVHDRNTFLVLVLGLQSLWNVLRILDTIFIEDYLVDYMSASGFNALTTVMFFSGNIFLIIGLIILNSQRVEFDLRASMEEIRTLRGIIPICSVCKKIRDDQGLWNQIEEYISGHSEAEFTHGICPECMKNLHPELFAED